MKRPAASLGLVFLFLLLTRLCHSGIVWVEEAYPAAAALQILSGRVIYRDFWYDKPPLTPVLYTFWGAFDGVVLRFVGALFLFGCAWLAWRFARDLWSPREGLVAAGLLAFFLTFDVPSAVMALAPDLLMLAPHLAAVYLAWRKKAFWAGGVAGVALLVNPKGVFVLAACAVWCWRQWLPLAAGFVTVNAAAVAVLAACGALPGYYQQVWVWGAIYSRSTFVDQPVVEGIRRTAAWAGFHAAIILAAAWYWWRERSAESRRFIAWSALALVGVVLGWRFFPRYYFLLLPAIVLAASRGFTLLPRRARWAAGLLIVIPLARFGPRYPKLAADLAGGREAPWADTAMNVDSRNAANLLLRLRKPGDTLLVWGYRPDIYLYTRIPAGSPFLDSQPLTGVIADRHLVQSEPSAPALAARNRQQLTGTRPTFVVDGLGPYNPQLAITNYPDLQVWLQHYQEIGRTAGSVLYSLRQYSPTGPRD